MNFLLSLFLILGGCGGGSTVVRIIAQQHIDFVCEIVWDLRQEEDSQDSPWPRRRSDGVTFYKIPKFFCFFLLLLYREIETKIQKKNFKILNFCGDFEGDGVDGFSAEHYSCGIRDALRRYFFCVSYSNYFLNIFYGSLFTSTSWDITWKTYFHFGT